ncbi:MAG: hypothetical protein QOK10_308 [Pseudonocardiales bacterium]|jgi:hypothetical protein|nr:hypothetical protein [Pseudonocardiales bacterium]
MTTVPPPPAESSAADEPPQSARPRTVDWAIYAIFARCAFSLAAGLLDFPYHSQLLDRARQLNPKYSESQLHAAVPSAAQGLFLTLATVFMILVLAKYIRDGKNWARWTFAVVSVLVFRDVFLVAALSLHGYPFLLRAALFLTGVSTLAAIVLLFLRQSSEYFRKPGAASASSPFGALFKPRRPIARSAATRPAGDEATKPAARPKVRGGDAGTAAADQPPQPPKRGGPRSKSRKASSG